jgi:uncharacterized protein YeaO (DUF488 family)
MKRIYEPATPEDGLRVLVDRLWPRGVSKAFAHLDSWEQDIAPSTELHRWYGHDPQKWEEFQARYEHELQEPQAETKLAELAARARKQMVTLLYASRNPEISHAEVLRRLLADRIMATTDGS